MLLLLACTPPDEPGLRRAGSGSASSEDTVSEDTGPGDTGDTSPSEDTEGPGDTDGCPPEMARVGDVCIDRWEASLVDASPYEVPEDGVAQAAAGTVPQAYISADVGALACDAAGKRLCTLDEWLLACAGPEGRTWPYGDTYDPTACNDTYPGSHPVIDYFGTSTGIWDTAHMNHAGIDQQPDTLDPAGANPGCVTPEGVYDLHGNLHEWIDDPAGTFKGGFYADAVINGDGCGYTTTAHETAYHDYSTGFRCCADPAAAAR